MTALPIVSGYAAVFVSGPYPGFILKTPCSVANFHRLVGESVRSVCQFNVLNGIENGFLYYDSKVLFPSGFLSCRRLSGSANFLPSLNMMENGPYDGFREEQTSASSKILNNMGYTRLQQMFQMTSSWLMMMGNRRMYLKVRHFSSS